MTSDSSSCDLGALTRLSLAVAGLALGRAIQVNNGTYASEAIFWVIVAAIATLAALLAPHRDRLEHTAARALPVLLATGLTLQFAQILTHPPADFLRSDEPNAIVLYGFGIAAAAMLAGAGLGEGSWFGRARIPLLLATHFLLGVWVIHMDPHPGIDVYQIQHAGIGALLEGRNPYSAFIPNPYHPDTSFYGPGMVENGRFTFGFIYPPLSLVLSSVGQLLGDDLRFAHLAAMTTTGGLIAYARPKGPRRNNSIVLAADPSRVAAGGLPPFCRLEGGVVGHVSTGMLPPRASPSGRLDHDHQSSYSAAGPNRLSATAAALFLFTPRGFYVLEQSWTEPLVLLALSLIVFIAVRIPRLLPYLYGLLLAMKQYLPLTLPAVVLLWGHERRLRFLGLALGIAAAITVPFFWWNPHDFVRSLITVQWHAPLRSDSLSLFGGGAAISPPPAWLCFGALYTICAIGLARLPRTPAAFAALLGATQLFFLLVNKQAFCNYYYMSLGAFWIALGVAPHSTVDHGVQ